MRMGFEEAKMPHSKALDLRFRLDSASPCALLVLLAFTAGANATSGQVRSLVESFSDCFTDSVQ